MVILVAMLNGVHHSSAGLIYLHSCKHGFGILFHPSLPALQQTPPIVFSNDFG